MKQQHTRLSFFGCRFHLCCCCCIACISGRGSGSGASTVATEAAPAAPTVAEAPLPASVVAFDDLVNTTFASFKQLTDKLGGSDVKSIVSFNLHIFI